MTQYSDFTGQIPETILQKTETYLSSNIALFRPSSYLGGIILEVNDYHMVIPSGCPPDTFFNQKRIRLDQRKIMAINPGDTVTCLDTTSTEPYYSFLIKQDLIHKIAREMGFYENVRFVDNLNPFSGQLLYVLKTFERECKRSDHIALMLDSLEIQIAALLLRECKTNMKKVFLRVDDVDSYIRRAMEYIRTYFSSNITIEDICSEIHVSPYHFIRMFKKKVGLSPHRYLMQVRIEKAMELLNSRCYTNAEIASVCGFASIPHFSSTFKEITGISPEGYKNQ